MLGSFSTAYWWSAGSFAAELIVCALLHRSGIPEQNDNRLTAAAPAAPWRFWTAWSGYGDRTRIRPQDACGLLDLVSFIGSPRVGTLVHACGPEPLLGAAQESCVGWTAGTQGIERFTQVRPTAEAAPAEASTSCSPGRGARSPCRRTDPCSKW